MASQYNDLDLSLVSSFEDDSLFVDQPSQPSSGEGFCMIDNTFQLLVAPETPSQSSSLPNASDTERRRWSWVWKHTPVNRISKKYYNTMGHSVWKCMYCNKEYRESGGTRIISYYLRTEHRILEVSPRQERKARIQRAIQLAMARAAMKTTPHRRNQVLETLHEAITTTIDPNVLEQLVVRWIVRCSVPFIMVETEEFCTLANYLNPNASSFLKSADTTYAWLLRTRENEMNA